MWTIIAFITGLFVGVVATVLVYYNNTKKFIDELEKARGERDALKGQLEALTDYLRRKVRK
ncbi:MAG: hypothetical protein QXS54_07620 [Candidatus Methanomethylicaceae archaeon]